MKRRLVTRFQRYVLNPVVKRLPASITGAGLIETTGRTSGAKRRQPVGITEQDGTYWIVSEHGRSNYVRNLEADPHVRIRYRGRWIDATALTVPDEDPKLHLSGINGVMVRLVSTQMLPVRITPT